MSKEKLISIIMPVYNCSEFLNKSIPSILNQTHKNIEILIADDGSTDDSKKIIEEYANQDKRIQLHHNDKNLGYLHTVNKLLPLCNGHYIGFQDADDFSELNRIETQLKEFTKDPQLQACMCSFNKVFYKKNKVEFQENIVAFNWINIQQNTTTFPYCAASIILKKETVEKHGYYNEYFNRLGAEHLYWILKIALEDKVISIKDVLYNYVFNNNSFTSTPVSTKQLHIGDFAFFLINQRKKYNDDGLNNLELKKDLIIYENLKLNKYNKTPNILKYLKLYRTLKYDKLKVSIPYLLNNINLLFKFKELKVVIKIFKERKEKL